MLSVIASGELKAQGIPKRIVVAGDTGVFWNRKSEEILISKGIERIQLLHENLLLKYKIQKYEAIVANDSLMFVKYEEVIGNLEDQSDKLLKENLKMSEELKKGVIKADRKRKYNNIKVIAVALISFGGGYYLAR